MKDLIADLDSYLRATFGRRYVPGDHDCVLFIAGWVDLVSGSSHADSIRGTYATHNEGLRKHVAGKGTICMAVQGQLLAAGWQQVTDPGDFRTGDIILTDGDHPGIWRGKSIVASAFGFAGHAYLHRRHATAALRWPAP
ncbi:DUF6950 family protein [Luteolibacter soli]|uniref:DUF6950 domain-containing protein n=1 Tax=Luteolibacter soli TaxID=3135280 RepID=A0ABU9B0P7_9BACT